MNTDVALAREQTEPSRIGRHGKLVNPGWPTCVLAMLVALIAVSIASLPAVTASAETARTRANAVRARAAQPARAAHATAESIRRTAEDTVLRTSFAVALAEARAQAAKDARFRAALEYASGAEAALVERAANDAVWDRMAACETGGNWSMQGSSYSGGVGFANSTWDAFGGQEFASNAGLAAREQQIVVAERVRDSVGYGAWGCASVAGVG